MVEHRRGVGSLVGIGGYERLGGLELLPFALLIVFVSDKGYDGDEDEGPETE